MTKKLSIALAALSLAVLGPFQPASAVDQDYVTGPAGPFIGYTVPFIVASQGDAINFINLDAFEHDVVSYRKQPGLGAPWCAEAGFVTAGSCPVIWTPLIGITGQTPVLGMDLVQPGENYEFFCSIHANMEGTLVVLPE